MRLLFVAGPQRSGTTALVHYLNRHPEVLLCMERYKWVFPHDVRPELFVFERILDYKLSPSGNSGGEREETNTPREYHAELLAGKERERLKWIGDKNPDYVKDLGLLSENNPGASFILTYRPLEEVAESFEARQKNPKASWYLGGLEDGVNRWNAAMRSTRNFVEGATNLNVLILDYHDFFYNDGAAIPLLSRFLDIEIDQGLRDAWREMSRSFEVDRRLKEPLSEEQRAYIQANKDEEAKQWVLDHIKRQRRELELYPPAAARALSEERRLLAVRVAKERTRIRRLEQNAEELREQNGHLIWRHRNLEQEAKQEAKKLRERNRNLKRQLQDIRSSKSWRLLDATNRLKKRLLRPLGR